MSDKNRFQQGCFEFLKWAGKLKSSWEFFPFIVVWMLCFSIKVARVPTHYSQGKSPILGPDLQACTWKDMFNTKQEKLFSVLLSSQSVDQILWCVSNHLSESFWAIWGLSFHRTRFLSLWQISNMEGQSTILSGLSPVDQAGLVKGARNKATQTKAPVGIHVGDTWATLPHESRAPEVVSTFSVILNEMRNLVLSFIGSERTASS